MGIIRETAEMSDTERMATRNSNSEYLNAETKKRERLSNTVNSFSEDVSEDDAKAQYPSIQCLKDIVHIVESGTDGIWNYRKWSDGTAECWGKKTVSVTTSTSWGGYYVGTIGDIDYPTNLFISAPVLSCTLKASNFPGHIYIDGNENISNTSSISVAANDQRTVECHIHLNAKGKWK